MTWADLYEEGFPHGTKDGYAKGCRGKACPAHLDGLMSCAQAQVRYQGDFAYRRRVDAGATPAEIAEADAAEREGVKAEKKQPRPVVVDEPDFGLDDELEDFGPEEIEQEETDMATAAEQAKIPLEKHGTTSGYYAGCRMASACPGVARVGKSCTAAVNEYQRELKARNAGAKAKPAAVSKPAPPIVPEAPAAVVEEQSLEAELQATVARLTADLAAEREHGKLMSEALHAAEGLAERESKDVEPRPVVHLVETGSDAPSSLGIVLLPSGVQLTASGVESPVEVQVSFDRGRVSVAVQG